MKYRTQTYYSESQKAMMWERGRQGATLPSARQLPCDAGHIAAGSGGVGDQTGAEWIAGSVHDDRNLCGQVAQQHHCGGA
jgi:hypothetical protein